MSNVYIAGIAMTVFGRHLDRSLDDMASEALNGALKDAGCKTSDLGVAFYAGMTNGLATGIGQFYELVTQLRGEAGERQVHGACNAIQENGGGMQGIEEAAVAIHILSK